MARFTSGQQLGEYKLIKLLGEGTFAEVWLGEKTTDITTRFALKVPSPVDKHGLPNGVDMSKVKSEAISWAAASDPGHINVVPIIEAKELQLVDSHGQPITTPAGPFFTIVTEYCAGGSLSDWLKQHRGKAPLAQALSIVRGVADGLVHLHSQRLIHRDIKPANVMLLGNTPRIADFGLVRGVDQTVTVGVDGLPVAAGSPAYMSPEALMGDRNEDVDVWALGILLYELLQGSRPTTVTASGPIPPLDSAVPFYIHELLLNVFQSDRTKRLGTARGFVDHLSSSGVTFANSGNPTSAGRHSLVRLSDEILQKVEKFPGSYKGNRFVIRAEGVGQAMHDAYIVDHDEGLADAAGCDGATMVRFQVRDPNGLFLYRVHASDSCASRLFELTAGDLSIGLTEGTPLAGHDLIVECMGRYCEMSVVFGGEPNQREWAIIWRLVDIQMPS